MTGSKISCRALRRLRSSCAARVIRSCRVRGPIASFAFCRAARCKKFQARRIRSTSRGPTNSCASLRRSSDSHRAPPMRAPEPNYVADFDSATAMAQSLARYLDARDFPMLGVIPKWGAPGMKVVGAAVNALPKFAQEWVYIISGAMEALPARRVHEAKTDRIAEWLVDLYPRRKYPAVMIGSSDGALVHLCAALGIPWLPQTCLVPLRRSGVHPDEPMQDLEWAREPARIFIEENPDVQLHHLFDPSQDRLMIRRMSYLRYKRLRLGAAYERFLEDVLEPDGTIWIVDCALKWPVTRLGERHVFQFGAVGGATID